MKKHVILEPSWQSWITSNLRRQSTPESIVAAMVRNNFDESFSRIVVGGIAASLASNGLGKPPSKSTTQTLPRIGEESPPNSHLLASPRGAIPRQRAPATPLALGRIPQGNLLALGDTNVSVLARISKPEIVVFSSVLSARECEELIGRSRDVLSRSTTVGSITGESQISDYRTSEGTFFRLEQDEFISMIDRRLAALVQWPVQYGEGLQVLRYEVGQEYLPHCDFFDVNNPGNAARLADGGQRVGTLLLYLNDPEDGGETVFPEVGLTIVPHRGNAVYFSNYGAANTVDPLTRHSGAPVRRGEKWIATKWLRQFARARARE